MTISIQANAAGTQGEIFLNGTPVQTFDQNVLQVSGNVLAGAAQNTDPSALTRKDYVDGANSLAANGYAKLPGGLIIQWGNIGTVAAGGSLGISFAIAFPTLCAAVTLSTEVGAPNDIPDLKYNSLTTNGFTTRNVWTGGSLGGKYIAVGY